MKIPRLLAVALFTLASFSLISCDNNKSTDNAQSATKTVKVGIVQLVEHTALDAANKGFVDALAAKGFVQGKNLEIDFQNAQADQSNLRNIAQRFVSNKVDLIGAIATPAAQTVANATQKIPIVATAITDFEIAKLVNKNEKPGTNVTGSSDMAPIDALIELILKIYPNAKTVGTLYSSSEINSQRQVEIFKQEAKKHNLEVKEATVSSVNDIQQAAQSLVGKIDVLYVPTDNTIASAVPALIKITEPSKLPIFAGEGGMVHNGCTASIAIDYYELGKIAGDMAADILQGKTKPQDMAIQFQKQFKTIFNETSVKNLGLTIPKEVNFEMVNK